MDIDINDLKQERGDIIEQMRGILNYAESEGRDLSVSEESDYRKLEKEQKKLRNSIQKMERLDGYTSEMNVLSSEPHKMGLGNGANNSAKVNADLDMFVRTGGVKNALSVGTGGGNAVIPYTSDNIGNLLREGNPLRQIITPITIENADSMEEVVTSGMPASAWVAETGARAETANAVLNKVTTELMEIYSTQTLTQRLLDQNHLDLSAWLYERMLTSIAELERDGFVNGTGTGNEPPGLLSFTMTTTADASRAFGTLQYVASGVAAALDDADKIIELFYELKAGHRQNATWLMNSNTARTIMQLKDGNSNYLWQHGDIASDRPNTLLGRPVVILEDLPDIAANAFPVWVGDWQKAIRWINGSDLTVMPDPYSNKPNVDFYSYFYTGFNVKDSEAIKAIKIEL